MGHARLCVLGLILLSTLLCGHAEGEDYDEESAEDRPDYSDVEKRPTAVATLQPNWPCMYKGERVTLRCEIKPGGDKKWEYHWTTDSSNKPSYYPHLSEVSISYAYVSHSGLYSCMGRVKGDPWFSTGWSEPVRLTVSEKPQSVLTVSPSWLSPGDSVTLNCEVDHLSPGWRFYWYKAVPNLSGDLLSYSYELLPGSSNGTEPKSFIVRGQTGTAGYVCRAGRGDPVCYTYPSHPQFVFSGDSHSPSLTVSPDSVQHFTSDSVSLICEGNSTQWRVMKFTRNSLSSYLSHCLAMTGSTCSLYVSRDTEAVYWCESGLGEFSNAVNITAQHTDIILLSPVRPVHEGRPVSLGCKLRRRQFVSVVFFYRNDKVVQNDTSWELKIPAASKSDEGVYRCEHSREVSPQSWMSVKDSRPERSSFPVPLIVGLVCALLLLILLLLSYRLAKDLCVSRLVQHTPPSF
ncbi:uncharacterized protein LOC143316768 isoform X2 [Chaetodon auriga]|uniref:uncharacterized protein LOC143316768 isoform X2 n=1 Tax=Chaetodon auriga TaxID=39042 RepID=UPI00403288E1